MRSSTITTPKKIYIYCDEGSNAISIRAVKWALSQELSKEHYCILPVKRSLFINDNWQAECALIIFPGGRDIPYHEALQGKPNESILRYVQDGGNYLGICAGAYYGAAQLEFEKGMPLEVITTRELRFFPGLATGPAYGLGLFRYEDESGSRLARIETACGQNLQAYFNGGCCFHSPDQFSHVHTIGYYCDIPNKPAAIVSCKINAGRAVLSGVHPEHGLPFFNRLPCITADMRPQLETSRRKLFRLLLQEFKLNLLPYNKSDFKLHLQPFICTQIE